MATRYSSLYGSVDNQATTSGAVGASSAYIYKGPFAERKDQIQVVRATYNLASGAIAAATSDVLKICKLPAGAKFLRVGISSGDDDVDTDSDFTFDLGTTTTANLLLNDSTALQAGAETALGTEELEELAVTADGDELLLTAVAEETNSTGTIYFLIEYVIPT